MAPPTTITEEEQSSTSTLSTVDQAANPPGQTSRTSSLKISTLASTWLLPSVCLQSKVLTKAPPDTSRWENRSIQIRVSDLVLVNEEGKVMEGGAQCPINGPAFAIHIYNAYGGTVVSTQEDRLVAETLGPRNWSVIFPQPRYDHRRIHDLIRLPFSSSPLIAVATLNCWLTQPLDPGGKRFASTKVLQQMTHKKSEYTSKIWLAFQPH
ncbi:hypothetical protein BJ170DRAFT_691008 [Xylariales sp. AK1849]|nr:hypothetical protein BJ170DRAFT_691008 [Xylariales sp. AK1849]